MNFTFIRCCERSACKKCSYTRITNEAEGEVGTTDRSSRFTAMSSSSLPDKALISKIGGSSGTSAEYKV